MNNQQPQSNQQFYQQPPQMQNFQPQQPQKKKLKTWQIVLIVIGALLVLGAIASAGSSSENENDKSSPASSASDDAKSSTAASVSASDYQPVDYLIVYNNQSEYKGKKVRLCGQINSIDTNITNVTYITFKEGISGLTGEIYCNLAESEGENAKSKYKEGDYVEIGGTVGDFSLKTLNIEDCYVFSSGDSVKNTIDEYKKKAKDEEASKEKEASEAVQKSKDDFIKECKTYTYKEIARNPGNFTGQKAKFEGKVIQVAESGNKVVLRVDVTKEENKFASGGYLYTDTVYVEYTRKSENESRILEDDIINMYGTLNGTKTYDSVLGSSITIPYLIAEYIDVVSG